ncbi:hypothetical protein BJY52DRAFT_1305127 [Lactarius psammicola]|nr:hypothetical protein BJY52DRAFT_1305127 [Lactarius psammicola]
MGVVEGPSCTVGVSSICGRTPTPSTTGCGARVAISTPSTVCAWVRFIVPDVTCTCTKDGADDTGSCSIDCGNDRARNCGSDCGINCGSDGDDDGVSHWGRDGASDCARKSASDLVRDRSSDRPSDRTIPSDRARDDVRDCGDGIVDCLKTCARGRGSSVPRDRGKDRSEN